MPAQVDDCVRSILDDPDSTDDESRAWAICKSQQEAAADDPADVVALADTQLFADGLDELCDRRGNEWARYESEYGVAWVGQQTGNTIFDAAEQQQADGVAVDVLEVRQSGDDGPGSDGDLLGMGVDMPNADVYIDWNIEAWPEGQQLSDAHVSIYATVDDLEQATGNDVAVVDTIGSADAQAMLSETFPSLEQQANTDETVTLRGLSKEGITFVRERFNVDVLD